MHGETVKFTSFFVYVASHHRKVAEMVDAATSLQAGLCRGYDLIAGSSKRLCPSLKCSNRLWSPLSVLFNGYRGLRRPGWRNRYSESLRNGRSRHRIQMGDQIFRARPDRPWGLPNLLYNGCQGFPGCKAAGS